jgi:hypothetical protein
MKKLLTLTFAFFFCLSFASAFEFDNSITYEKEDLKVVFENRDFWGIGELIGIKEKLGEVELRSHLSITEVRNVMPGNDRLVMYYDFTNWKKYSNGLGDVEFINVKTGNEIEKDYYFAKAIYEDVEVKDYDKICAEEIFINGSVTNACVNEIIETHIESQIVRWEKLDSNDIPGKNARIGLFTDVNPNDHIDGIWTIAGKKVKRHAEWTDGFNAGLVSVFTFDGSTLGEALNNTINGIYNLTDNSGGDILLETTECKRGNCTNSGNLASGERLTWTNNIIDNLIDGQNNEFTISFWFNNSGTGCNSYSRVLLFGSGATGTDINDFALMHKCDGTGGKMSVVGGPTWPILNSDGINDISEGEWHNVIMELASNNIKVWVDNVSEIDVVWDYSTMEWEPNMLYDGANADSNERPNKFVKLDEMYVWNRTLTSDEKAALADDTFFEPEPLTAITLNSPIDGLNSSSQDIEFNCSATSETGVLNLSLIIDDVFNFTIFNTTSNENLSLVQTINLISEGNHNWTCEGCNENSCDTPTVRDFLIDSTPPQIEFTSPANDSSHIVLPLTLNISIVEVNPDTCIWSNDSFVTNNTITCGNNITEFFTQGINVVEFWMNDSSGNENQTSITFNIIPISVTLNSPSNDTYSETITVPFNASASALTRTGLINMSLWTDIDGIWNLTETRNFDNFSLDYFNYLSNLTGEIINETTYNTGEITDRELAFDLNLISYAQITETTSTGARTTSLGKIFDFTYVDYINISVNGFTDWGSGDNVGVTITLEISNETGWHSLESWSQSSSTTDVSLSVDNLTMIQQKINGTRVVISIQSSIGRQKRGRWYSIDYGNFQDVTEVFNHDISSTTLWNVQSCNNNNDCAFADNNWTVSLNLTAPVINLEEPRGQIDYHALGNNLTINWTVIDTNLDSCWFEYNSINTTVTCDDNSTLFTPVLDVQNLTFYANDTAGNLESNFTSWTYKILENNVSYNTPVLETASEAFTLNITTAGMQVPSDTYLNYNGTSYQAVAVLTGDNYLISRTIDIPTVDSNIIQSFSFNYTVDGTQTQTQDFNQTVININFSSCTTPINLVYNFTTYDTDSGEVLNSSLEATFSFFAATSSGEETEEYNFESINESKSNWLFCLESSGINVSTDATISFYKDGYDRREYLITDESILGNYSQNIPLFLSLTSETDIVTVIIKDQNYNEISGALVSIQEWNIGTNTYSNIGMFTTNEAGSGIINLELYNRWYRAIITYNEIIVEVTEPQKLADTTWPITIQLEIDNPYSLFDSISKGLTFSESTNITTYTWIDANENTQTGCLTISNLTNLGYQNISTECVASTAGIINYQLSANGEYQITGTLYLIPTYNISQLTDVLFEKLGASSLTTRVSPFGKVLSFIFIGTASAIGIAAQSPVWGALLLIGSLFITAKLGWLNISASILWGFLSIIIVILFRLSKK